MGTCVPLEEPRHICPGQYSALLSTRSGDVGADNDISDTPLMRILSKTEWSPQMLPMSTSMAAGSRARYCQEETSTDTYVTVRRGLDSETFIHKNAGRAMRTLCGFTRKHNKSKESQSPDIEVAAEASHLNVVDGELGDGVGMFEVSLVEESHSGVSGVAGDQNGVSFVTSGSKDQEVSFRTNETPSWCSSAECRQSHKSSAVPSNGHMVQSLWKRLLQRRTLQSPYCATSQVKNVETSGTFWSEDTKAFRKPKIIAENDNLLLHADDKPCSTTTPVTLCLDMNKGPSALPPDDRISLLRGCNSNDGTTPYVEGTTGCINGPAKKAISVEKKESNVECLDHELITGVNQDTAGGDFRELNDSTQQFFSPVYNDGQTRRGQQRQGRRSSGALHFVVGALRAFRRHLSNQLRPIVFVSTMCMGIPDSRSGSPDRRADFKAYSL